MNSFDAAAIDLARAIVALESSPMQRDYVPPEIMAMAKEVVRLYEAESA